MCAMSAPGHKRIVTNSVKHVRQTSATGHHTRGRGALYHPLWRTAPLLIDFSPHKKP